MFDAKTINAITAMATTHKIDPTALLALAEVESGGIVAHMVNGSLEPAIRFEGHYFDRRLTGAVRERARAAGLSAPEAGKIRNPPSQTGRWNLLNRATQIDRKAALESTSWGLGQVMGAHWAWLGYESIEALVGQVRQSTSGQIALMLRFIKRAGLAPLLENHDWRNFARRYNGPAFAQNHYDKKLETAWIGWQSKLMHQRNTSAIIAAVDKTPPRH